MTVTAVIAVLVTLAVVAGRGPRGRRVERLRPARGVPVESAAGVQSTAGVGSTTGSTGRSPWSSARDRGARRGRGDDLAEVVIEVASELRAGAAPGGAWGRVLGHPVRDGTPGFDDFSGVGDRRQVAAVVAAGRLAADLGAPLAQVLDGVAAALVRAAEADGDRAAALAGPRATTRILTGLPVLGIVLGMAVGADPVAVLVDGQLGTAALLTGVALLLVGRWWIARLVRAAVRAGRDA